MSQVTISQALADAQTLGLERLDAQLLLLHALGKPAHARAWLLAHDTDSLADGIAHHFSALGRRRAAGEPLAYIVGHKEFFGLDLRVDARVLVPRPDTETLVQWSLSLLQGMQQGIPRITPHEAVESALEHELRVLDLGTGSGAVALALAHSLRKLNIPAHLLALDASAEALEVAVENARRLGLDVAFTQSHWFDAVPGKFDLIVSNPPYIACGDAHLKDLAHEPSGALIAGADGLDDLRQIIEGAPRHLHTGGWLLLEHGHDQAAPVRQLLRQRGFEEVRSACDLSGIERCSGGRLR